jgi:hypothetical protein
MKRSEREPRPSPVARSLAICSVLLFALACASCEFLSAFEESLIAVSEVVGDYVEITGKLQSRSQQPTSPTSSPSGPQSPTPPARPGMPPVASFFYQPLLPETNYEIRFDAASSSDRDGPITWYAWEFDDGSTEVGQVVQKAFLSEGQHGVTLTVYDREGMRASCARSVEVRSDIHLMPDLMPGITHNETPTKPASGGSVAFRHLQFDATDVSADHVILIAKRQVNLRGYEVRSSRGYSYTFQRNLPLNPGDTVVLRSGFGQGTGKTFYWGSSADVWSDSEGSAGLYDSTGQLIDIWVYRRTSQ